MIQFATFKKQVSDSMAIGHSVAQVRFVSMRVTLIDHGANYADNYLSARYSLVVEERGILGRVLFTKSYPTFDAMWGAYKTVARNAPIMGVEYR